MCRFPEEPFGRTIPVREAIGAILAHDLTEIRPEEFKGPAFKKGHVVTKNDVDHLLRLGKRNLFILDIPDGMIHEDEAALILARALAGPGVTFDPKPSEGKITLKAAHDGLFRVNEQALTDFNMVDDVMCATRHGFSRVKAGDVLAGTRAIPLVVDRRSVEAAAAIAVRAGGPLSVATMAAPRTGLIITGNEVFSGLVEDRFASRLTPKLEALNCPVLKVVFAPDDSDFIAREIEELLTLGVGLIILTAGMSVDPDDVTRLGVVKAGGTDLLYGSAVLPGAMLLLARIGDVSLIGVPACGLFHQRTIFDLVLPRILAGEAITRRDLAAMGHGGLCLDCEVCRYPVCPFGK